MEVMDASSATEKVTGFHTCVLLEFTKENEKKDKKMPLHDPHRKSGFLLFENFFKSTNTCQVS